MKINLRRYFITGIIILLPVFITSYILVNAIQFADNLLGRFFYPYLEAKLGFPIFGLGLLSILALTFITGFLAANVFINKIIPWFEQWFLRIPFVVQIYPSIKQLVKFLFSQEKISFKKAVIFEYPRAGIYSIGFITNELTLTKGNGEKIEALCVLVASVPNPLTGFFMLVPRKDVEFLDVSIDDAFKMIISGGVLMPPNLNVMASKTKSQV